MEDIRQYLSEEEAEGILKSLKLLKSEFHRVSSTPVVDEAVQLISNQLDGLAFKFLTDEDFAKQTIRMWEYASFFRKKHDAFTVTDARAFVAFKIRLSNFVETRSQRVTLSPFANQTQATDFAKNLEPLNARFPLTPFSSKHHRWVQVGSEFRIPCRACGATGKVTCEKCEGQGQYKARCGSCGGSGYVRRLDIKFGAIMVGKLRPGGFVGTRMEPCAQCFHRGWVIETCSRCRGTGEVRCGDCNGTGQQYHRHEVETRAGTKSLEKIVTTEKLPAKWLKKIRPSEKIVIQDYLPGAVNQGTFIGCDVKIQKAEIAIIPAALVEVQELDGEKTKLVISGNQVYPQGNRFGISPLRASIPVIVLLAVLGAFGYLAYRYDLPSYFESEPVAVVEPDPVDEPEEVVAEDEPEIEKKKPKKRKRGKKGKRRKTQTEEPLIVEIPNPEPDGVVPPPPPPAPADSEPFDLDEYLKNPPNPYDGAGGATGGTE